MLTLTNRLRAAKATSGRSGFSLVELVVVMTILTIIAGIALPRFTQFKEKAQDGRRISDLVQIEKALEAYFVENGSYPTTGGAWRGEAPHHGALGYDANGYIPGLVPDYMKELPRDPHPEYPTGNRGYLYKSNGTDYKFLAHNTPTNFPTDHRFLDTLRQTWAYQVSSEGGVNW